MPKRRAANIAFALLLTAIFCGLAKRNVSAVPLQWHDRGHYREARVNRPLGQAPGFSLLSAKAAGVGFTNRLARARMVNANLLNGAGVAAGDVDGDGLCDLYLCSLDGDNGLFKNLGDWKFKNITAGAGVGAPGMSSTGAAFGDVDGDGDLDIYVANYGETSVLRSGGSVSVRTINGKQVVTGRYANRIRIMGGDMVEGGEPDFLYLNDGSGNFTNIDWTDGNWLDENGQPIRKAFWDLGLSVMIRDVNQDGRPDIYVCNDFQTPDRFWINQGDGKFQLINELALRHRSYFAMAVDFADINRDGHDDFFVADMMSPTHLLEMTQVMITNPFAKPIDEFINRPIIHRNTLLVNRGDNSYMDTANFSGVAATEWTWGATFLDVDLDGLEDLLIANGHAFDTQNLDTIERTAKLGKLPVAQARKKVFLYPPLNVPNMVFRNEGGLRFTEAGSQWGFESKNVSHGISLCDLDNDGDQDVVVNCLNEPPLLYRNNATAPRVSVALRGARGNTRGIGARIIVRGGPYEQSQEMIAGGRYLAGDEPLRRFAVGQAQSLSIEVAWPSGSRTVVTAAKPNYAYEIHEKNSHPKPPPLAKPPPMFIDASDWLNHEHSEHPSDDFLRQPLLPRRLTESGPGVAFIDWDGDGRDELFFGNGAGGKLV
ncbi:MAG: CRTAC1 family protein, partial [Verrucomicrobia bacterium]|nr:CRTAC1 family protein [Verrucomicrobiota bacterium]